MLAVENSKRGRQGEIRQRSAVAAVAATRSWMISDQAPAPWKAATSAAKLPATAPTMPRNSSERKLTARARSARCVVANESRRKMGLNPRISGLTAGCAYAAARGPASAAVVTEKTAPAAMLIQKAVEMSTLLRVARWTRAAPKPRSENATAK